MAKKGKFKSRRPRPYRIAATSTIRLHAEVVVEVSKVIWAISAGAALLLTAFEERSLQSTPDSSLGEERPFMPSEHEYEAEVREWLDTKVQTGRYSTTLVHELCRHLKNRTANVFAIYDEIETLEFGGRAQATNTKAARKFKRPPLRGLWHKHHFQAAFLQKNVQNHWQVDEMSVLIEARFKDGRVPNEINAGRIAHDFVLGGYEARARARQMTGEWIVFAKCRGANYYLTLGMHGEDPAIATRAQAAVAEFPEIRWP